MQLMSSLNDQSVYSLLQTSPRMFGIKNQLSGDGCLQMFYINEKTCARS